MDNPGERPKIIITADIVRTLVRRYNLKPKKGAIERLEKIESGIIEGLRAALVGQNIHIVNSEALERAFKASLEHEDLPIVTIDDIHVPHVITSSDLFQFHISREYDVRSNALRHGPRPHAPSFREQLDYLKERLAGKSIALVDTGIYGGDTLSKTARMLEENGISVKKIYVGVVRKKGAERLRKDFPDTQLVHVLGDEGICDDWMFEMRDLLFGGRVVKKDSKPIGSIHYCDVPEFLLPNPTRMTPVHRAEALTAINASALRELGMNFRNQINNIKHRTGIRVVRKPSIQIFNRRVPVYRLINDRVGRAW